MKSVAFVLGTVLALATTTQAAEPPVTRSLSLEECIQIALEHNLGLQSARLGPQIARFHLAGSYGSYDPTFSLSGSHNYRLSPGGLNDEGLAYVGRESETDTFGSSLGGLLPWGLTYNLGGSTSDQHGDAFNPTNSAIKYPFENSSANVGFMTMRQPLLKDFWTDQSRLQIFVAKKDVQVADWSFSDRVMSTVTRVEEVYYGLIAADEFVRVQEMGLELAERLVAENRRRVEVGALAPLDEKQAESQAAASRAALLEARAARDTAERGLKSTLSDDYGEWKDVRIQPADVLVANPQAFNLQESWRRGMMKPSLQIARLTVEKQTGRVKLSKNQLFPRLDLVGTFGYDASDREFSGALGQVADRDYPYHSYGAQLSIPLSRTAERNAHKIEKSYKEQYELDLKSAEQGMLILIEDSIGNARSALERVEATKQARVYAEDALKAEQTKLEKGKSTSFVVLDLQSKLTRARSDEIAALRDYNMALANLALNEGSTLERRNIDIKVIK
jgi:outer membrane protein TolC